MGQRRVAAGLFLVGLATLALLPSCASGTDGRTASAPAPLHDELALGHELERLAADAKVVGIGEATHGSGTAISARGELTMLLVDRLNFDVVALEAPAERCELLARYVAGEEVDPRAALQETFYWCWQNEEMLGAIRLLREWNARQASQGSTRRVRFTGMDVFPGGASRARAMANLTRFAPDVAARVDELSDRLMSLSTDERTPQNTSRRAALDELERLHEPLRAQLASAGAPQIVADQTEESLRNYAAFLDYVTSGPIPVWGVRDSGMFKNTVRLTDQAQRGVIVWAHNGHIENSAGALGGMLRAHFRTSYLAIGSVIGRGQTLALDPTNQRVVVHDLLPADGESVESRLLESAPGGALIGLNRDARGSLASMLRKPRKARLDVGFYVPPEDSRFGTYDSDARFDAVYFVPTSSPSTPIRTWPDGVPMHDG
jgi:erythromycin esterase